MKIFKTDACRLKSDNYFWETKDSEGRTNIGFFGAEIQKAYFTILKSIRLSRMPISDQGRIISETLTRLGFRKQNKGDL